MIWLVSIFDSARNISEKIIMYIIESSKRKKKSSFLKIFFRISFKMIDRLILNGMPTRLGLFYA